mmetsp:Transcript_22336/g.50503  ORF Transcript_22336/g.50503 Transcript_22336/m.50503 type:complete len:394 (+) Transcript_22336:74-1255(+)
MLLPNWLLQTAVATQFYFYGRKHFTQSGWLKASSAYAEPFSLDVKPADCAAAVQDLAGKVFVVTGATSGIGREVALQLSGRGATVLAVCRDQDRARAMADELTSFAKGAAKGAAEACGSGGPPRGQSGGSVVPFVADVALASDVRRVASELDQSAAALKSSEKGKVGGIDGLICNAGALLHERTVTREGVETTVAAHLAFGSYLLTEQLKPALRRALEPRVVLVSSGGMLTTRWPGLARAAFEDDQKARYDGQLAYAYAKRGQVLLAQHWADREAEAREAEATGGGLKAAEAGSRVAYVSAHPGWVDTPGVAAAYGSFGARLLAPLRPVRTGAEGIVWLAAAPAAQLEPGAFYLDRSPRPKHLPCWGFTANSAGEASELVGGLERLAAKSLRP